MEPSVSILLPVLDEEDFIDACLDSVLAQDYDGAIEVIVAEGGSTDHTPDLLRRRAETDPRLRVIPNPRRRQSHGINLAAEAATGEILIRADAHTTYEPDYVRRSVVDVLRGEFVAAGGPMRPVGTTPIGRAIAHAMRSRLAVGPAHFHHASESVEADTVYLGAFRREQFLRFGLRTFPSGVAEDADFYYRWRKAGGTVFVDPGIQSSYRPRGTFRGLWRQNHRYGQGKAEMLFANGTFPSPRPLGPLVFTLLVLAGLVLGIAGIGWLPFWGVLLPWLAGLSIAARKSGRLFPLTVTAGVVMHLSYGLGLLLGLLRGPSPVRHLRGGGTPGGAGRP